jgi:hypothetical protein
MLLLARFFKKNVQQHLRKRRSKALFTEEELAEKTEI